MQSSSPKGSRLQAQYGDKWAFKVDDGVLECRGENSIGGGIYKDKTYALNGVAKQTNKYSPVEEFYSTIRKCRTKWIRLLYK